MNKTLLFTAFGAGVFLATAGYLLVQRWQQWSAPVEQPQAAMPEIALPRAPVPPSLPARVVAAPPVTQEDAPLQPGRYSPYGLPCDVTLATRVTVAAQVALSLQANCALSQPLTVRHAGLRFSGHTDEQGSYRVLVPALEKDALFKVDFADGQGVQVHVTVPDAPLYRRVVLQWQGDQGVSLHAREFGAGYGAAGHVWTGAPGQPEDAAARRGGFLSALGMAGGLHAQVYSIPRGVDRLQGVVRISVEAEVTTQNCGKAAVAETLQPGPGGLHAAGLRVMMPDCTAVGEFVVLKNVLRDLKIARN